MVSHFGFVLKIVNQASFCPYALREISVLSELALGRVRYRFALVPPQPNFQPDCVPCVGGSRVF